MIVKLLPILTFIAALGAGVVGGVFFAFSNFVMPAFARLPAAGGIAAMNSINVTVITPMFMTALFGTGLVCIVLIAGAIIGWNQPGSFWLLAGALIYLVGNPIVTMAFNVPLNDALAAVDPASSNGAAVWTSFLRDWVMWNHVRTVTAIVAMASFWLAAR
ncbi:anthrone oxygenase family protein [Mesorhizobium sp. Cs1299R1N3]|uniref:anthrone oxygenase family protein n=1 Tax=Mesorhizobium sp. Cs1299R1N3 TaxID=3015173 RepID=UPI00301DBC37